MRGQPSNLMLCKKKKKEECAQGQQMSDKTSHEDRLFTGKVLIMHTEIYSTSPIDTC